MEQKGKVKNVRKNIQNNGYTVIDMELGDDMDAIIYINPDEAFSYSKGNLRTSINKEKNNY